MGRPTPQAAPGSGTATLSDAQQGQGASENPSNVRHPASLYLNAEVGFTNVNLGSAFAPVGDQNGLSFGIGAGLRILSWTVGLRARVAPLGPFTLMETNLEAGFHLPVGRWEPYVMLHGGYTRAFMNAQATQVAVPSGSFPSYTPTSPDGFDLGGALVFVGCGRDIRNRARQRPIPIDVAVEDERVLDEPPPGSWRNPIESFGALEPFGCAFGRALGVHAALVMENPIGGDTPFEWVPGSLRNFALAVDELTELRAEL